MGQLRERMEADLKLAGYSPQTQKIHLLYARRFTKHFMRLPEEMGAPFPRATPAWPKHLLERRPLLTKSSSEGPRC
jgi:hypothetical protein